MGKSSQPIQETQIRDTGFRRITEAEFVLVVLRQWPAEQEQGRTNNTGTDEVEARETELPWQGTLSQMAERGIKVPHPFTVPPGAPGPGR
jgi:hypothetical protein